MREAPKILTVVMADAGPTTIAIVHENEWAPFVRRTVQIELTEEQRAKLIPRSTVTNNGCHIYEHVERCWFEPEGSK